MDYAAYLLIGILAGFIGGLLGLSGGVITVPCLFIIFRTLDFPQGYLMHMAIGTSLAAMVPNSFVSAWVHNRRGAVAWHLIRLLLPSVLIGSIIGAVLAHYTPGVWLEAFFGLFALAYGLYLLLKKRPPSGKERQLGWWTCSWMGFSIGSISNLLGIGGGIITAPLLMSYRYEEKISIGTSAAIGVVVTLFGALAYLYLGIDTIHVSKSIGYLYIPAFLVIAVASALTAPYGAYLAHRLSGKNLRRVFAIALLIIGLLMII